MESVITLPEEKDDLPLRVEIDPGDFAAIYEEYFELIYSYVFYRLQNSESADDITAQVFEEALKNWGRYQPERASLATWLFAIARNTVNKHFRSQKIRQWISLETIAPATADNAPPIEEVIIKNEKLAKLMRLVSGLNERQRDVLGLKFGARLSNRQIAELTGLSPSNVGVTLYRTLNNLRECCQEVDNDEE
jgi:RNA polymerase sigma-70 factor (ECF subfamily)